MRVTTDLDPALSIFEELSVDGSLEIQIILGLGKAMRKCQPDELRRRGRSVTYFATNTQAVGGYRFWASTPSIWWRLLTFDARVRRVCSPLARATSRRCMFPAVMERSERRSLSGLAGEETNTSSRSSALTRQVGDLTGSAGVVSRIPGWSLTRLQQYASQGRNESFQYKVGCEAGCT